MKKLLQATLKYAYIPIKFVEELRLFASFDRKSITCQDEFRYAFYARTDS